MEITVRSHSKVVSSAFLLSVSMFLSNVRDYIVRPPCNHFNDFPCGIINVRLPVSPVPSACSLLAAGSRPVPWYRGRFVTLLFLQGLILAPLRAARCPDPVSEGGVTAALDRSLARAGIARVSGQEGRQVPAQGCREAMGVMIPGSEL